MLLSLREHSTGRELATAEDLEGAELTRRTLEAEAGVQGYRVDIFHEASGQRVTYELAGAVKARQTVTPAWLAKYADGEPVRVVSRHTPFGVFVEEVTPVEQVAP